MHDTTVIQRIRSLENERGELTPHAVLDDARDPSSPLHSQFDWDDTRAAEKYRVEQARRLIRTVRLVITERNTQVRSVAYVRDPDKEYADAGYVSTAALRTDEQRARAALVKELERAAAALARAYDVAYAVGLTNEIEALRRQIDQIREVA